MKIQILVVVACFVVVTAELTPCQQQRLVAATSTNHHGIPRVLGAFIPSCDKEGTYSAKQCHASTGMCWCVREDGSRINLPARGKYQACKCVRHRDTVDKPRLVGSYVPQCQENGHYSKSQCWGSVGTCWCADEKTGEEVSSNSADC